jgi:predicted MPP superfamily phosphohydrolase
MSGAKDERKLPEGVETAAQMMYRSGGLGIWGAVLRFGGMPLEKIAL